MYLKSISLGFVVFCYFVTKSSLAGGDDPKSVTFHPTANYRPVEVIQTQEEGRFFSPYANPQDSSKDYASAIPQEEGDSGFRVSLDDILLNQSVYELHQNQLKGADQLAKWEKNLEKKEAEIAAVESEIRFHYQQLEAHTKASASLDAAKLRTREGTLNGLTREIANQISLSEGKLPALYDAKILIEVQIDRLKAGIQSAEAYFQDLAPRCKAVRLLGCVEQDPFFLVCCSGQGTVETTSPSSLSSNFAYDYD